MTLPVISAVISALLLKLFFNILNIPFQLLLFYRKIICVQSLMVTQIIDLTNKNAFLLQRRKAKNTKVKKLRRNLPITRRNTTLLKQAVLLAQIHCITAPSQGLSSVAFAVSSSLQRRDRIGLYRFIY